MKTMRHGMTYIVMRILRDSQFGKTVHCVIQCVVSTTLICFLALGSIAHAADDATSQYKYSSSTRRASTNRESSYSPDTYSGSSSRQSIFGSKSSSSTDRTTRDTGKNQDRYRTRERASNQPGAKGATAAPKKTEKTIKGKKPAAKKASGGQSRGATTVEFKMRASPNANILSVETTDLASTMHTVAQVGQTVVTRVVFRNGQQAKFDTIEFALRYDPKILSVVAIDDTMTSSFLAEPSVAKVDAERGILVYKAKFAQPRKDDLLVVAKIQWKALAPAEHTSIDFLNQPSFPSRVLDGEKNLLQPSAADNESEGDEEDTLEPSPKRGLLGADVAIAPTLELLEKMRDEETALTGVALARQISEGTAIGGISLAAAPHRSTVKVEDEFLVDIKYENPNRVEVDSVKVTVTYDPEVLEVVDYDEDGWITKGINAYDGAYHEDLPFDFHIRNQAHNALGKLIYHMGFAGRTRIPSGGTLFTIKFRALAPAAKTRIGFEFDDATKTPPTSISFLGFNLIGSPEDRMSALREASVTIVP